MVSEIHLAYLVASPLDYRDSAHHRTRSLPTARHLQHRTLQDHALVLRRRAASVHRQARHLDWPQTVALNSNLRPLLEPFIEPAKLPLWQVGSAASALLAIGLYLLADWHLRQIEGITVVRNTLALYTIACTLYIAWKISAGIEWPVLEFVLLPWT